MKHMNMKNFKRTLQSPTVLTILVVIMIVLVMLTRTIREPAGFLNFFGLGTQHETGDITIGPEGSHVEMMEANSAPSSASGIDEPIIYPTTLQKISYFDSIPPTISTVNELYMAIQNGMGNVVVDTATATKTEIEDAMNKLVDNVWGFPEAPIKAEWNSIVALLGAPPLKIEDGQMFVLNPKRDMKYFEVTTKTHMMVQIALQTAMLSRANNMTKPRFTDIEIPKLTIRQIMDNYKIQKQGNLADLADYTIVIEAVGGSSGPETITSPTKETVEAAMNRLHANSSVDVWGRAALRIKHTQGSNKFVKINVSDRPWPAPSLRMRRLSTHKIGNSFTVIKFPHDIDNPTNTNYDPSRHIVEGIFEWTDKDDEWVSQNGT